MHVKKRFFELARILSNVLLLSIIIRQFNWTVQNNESLSQLLSNHIHCECRQSEAMMRRTRKKKKREKNVAMRIRSLRNENAKNSLFQSNRLRITSWCFESYVSNKNVKQCEFSKCWFLMMILLISVQESCSLFFIQSLLFNSTTICLSSNLKLSRKIWHLKQFKRFCVAKMFQCFVYLTFNKVFRKRYFFSLTSLKRLK